MCEQRLVNYNIPDEWQIRESFPRNAMGKVIKPQLRELTASG
jgi:long-chain acyl-CoA synthetase